MFVNYNHIGIAHVWNRFSIFIILCIRIYLYIVVVVIQRYLYYVQPHSTRDKSCKYQCCRRFNFREYGEDLQLIELKINLTKFRLGRTVASLEIRFAQVIAVVSEKNTPDEFYARKLGYNYWWLHIKIKKKNRFFKSQFW